ncbi:hypothetical protein F4778DRAFT_146907 [Xylariomycetidae sp. FL2044]|nr:hypothetical protein F4778DRAFT_146907 [Xylariomycetidae sp. FL2044]
MSGQLVALGLGNLVVMRVTSSASTGMPFTASYSTPEKPDGFDKAEDLAAFAIVLPDGASGWTLVVTSGGKEDTITDLKAGLNYGNAQLNAGVQRAVLKDANGETVAVASGGRCVSGDSCPDCAYNMSPTVLEFGEDQDDQTCDEVCDSPPEDGEGSGKVYIDPAIWTNDDPDVACAPPCTLILPHETLPTATTISVHPITETMEETWASATSDDTVIYDTKTITTVITIPAVTTNVVEFSNIVWNKTVGLSDIDSTHSLSSGPHPLTNPRVDPPIAKTTEPHPKLANFFFFLSSFTQPIITNQPTNHDVVIT